MVATDTTPTDTSETPPQPPWCHATPATPKTQEQTPFQPFVLEHELRNYHNKAFVKRLISDLAASVSKHVYGKYQVNSFFFLLSKFKPPIVNTHAIF